MGTTDLELPGEALRPGATGAGNEGGCFPGVPCWTAWVAAYPQVERDEDMISQQRGIVVITCSNILQPMQNTKCLFFPGSLRLRCLAWLGLDG